MAAEFEEFKDIKEEIQEVLAAANADGAINFNFINIEIKENRIQVEQRAEGGGQINRNVGMNANQGGQNARDNSQTANDRSQFADGNGRSGIAGRDNDELGGQQGIKIRDSKIKRSKIRTDSSHNEGAVTEDQDVEQFQLPSLNRLNRTTE
ncbi:hypothetical protein ACFWM3_23795 [Gottfriedia sp. NPDC058432]|uniref:hypothetical protein n=1 Tax=Bacillaceae TaxID=186817 RepID=UPI000A4DB9C5|nr:hypothetical protein [Bacillus sp. FJAT-25509]